MRRSVVGALMVLGLVAGTAGAGTDELVFRAIGWYAGKADISDSQIKCEIPTIVTAIPDGAFSMGLWNTYGEETLFFPNRNSAFGNPCGGWLQFQNNLATLGLTVTRVNFKMTIPGARQWRNMVPTQKGFPTACRALRKTSLFVGGRMDPATAETGHSISGAPNVVFIQMTPFVRTELVHCLRSVYASLPTDVFTSLPLVVRASAVAVDDNGTRYRSNTVSYTLSMRHVCGNGRVDDGEYCDPAQAPFCSTGLCENGQCSNDPELTCATDGDCTVVCSEAGTPTECTCLVQQ